MGLCRKLPDGACATSRRWCPPRACRRRLPCPGGDANVPPPVLRVGILVDVAARPIAADSGVLIRTSGPGRGRSAWRGRRSRPCASAAGPRRGGSACRSRAWPILSPRSEIGERAERIAGQPVQIRWNAETRTHQVRVGAFGTRPLAMDLVGRLHAGGIPGTWVVEESAVRRGPRAAAGDGPRVPVGLGPPGAARGSPLGGRGDLPRTDRGAGGARRNHHGRERGQPRGLPAGRGSQRAVARVLPADRGAEGAGGRRAHVCAAQPRPVPVQGLRHLRDAGLPGLSRARHREPAVGPRGGGDARRRGDVPERQ